MNTHQHILLFQIKTLNDEIHSLQQDCIKLYKELDSADVLEVVKPISVRTELFTNGKSILVVSDVLYLW